MKKIPILGIAALLVAQLSAPVSAQTITAVAILGTNAPLFSAASPFSPESMAVDQGNNCYLGDQKTGNIIKVTPGGAASLFATIPGPANGGGQKLHGLKFDGAGNLCACCLSSQSNYNGIFKVSPNGTVTAFSVGYTANGQNDLTFDRQGNMYVSVNLNTPQPFTPSQIWKITPAGNATLWSNPSDTNLVGTTNHGIPAGVAFIGANGMAFNSNYIVLYNLNTAQGEVITIPVNTDGSAGATSVLVQSQALVGADGIAMDINGNIYAAINFQNQIAKVTLGGTVPVVSIVASTNTPGGSLLWEPTSIAFGYGSQQTTLLICNNANELPAPLTPNPTLGGLLELNLGIAGISANGIDAFPSITNQTTDFTCVLGQTNVLSVGAMGGILSYQWYFDGNPIPGQTGSTLTLVGLSATNAGAYTVQISNPVGATNSAAIDVSYFGSPQLYFGMIMGGAIDQNFEIDYSTNLAVTNWTTLTNLSLTTSPQVFVDTTGPAQSQRFYRALTH